MNFEQAIIDDPTNIALRLIYADWLEEQGDPRAEFVRLDCELRQGTAKEQRDNETRWFELWQDLDDGWLVRLFTNGTPSEEAECLKAYGRTPTGQVIGETTGTGMRGTNSPMAVNTLMGLFKRSGVRPSAATAVDFRLKNSREHAVEDLFRPEDYGFVVVSAEEMKEIFKTVQGGWEIFRERFPNSAGTVTFSRVGFNHARTEALFYWGQQVAPLMGNGSYYFCQKKGDHWHTAGAASVWIS